MAKAKVTNTEVDAYTYIKQELETLGWNVKNPARVPDGEVYKQNEVLANPDFKAMIDKDRPEAVIILNSIDCWVIETKRDKKDIDKALDEAKNQYAQKINKSKKIKCILISGVAGNDTDGYIVRNQYLKNGIWNDVLFNGKEKNILLSKEQVSYLISNETFDWNEFPDLPEEKYISSAIDINEILHNAGINKFLFEGPPGTGKTESVKQIARILERELFIVDFDSVIDSKLGQTSKNISLLFNEISSVANPNKVIILFDEIDSIAIDRINSNDLREMGRATSSVLKGLDNLNNNILLIATTNLYKVFDKALSRRFDAIIDFSNYTKQDLIEVGEAILNDMLQKFKYAGRNMRLFKKILESMDVIPYPGELKNLIKTSIAFSDSNNEYDYLKKLYINVNKAEENMDLKYMQNKGFTVREIEILTGISKSQVARELKDDFE